MSKLSDVFKERDLEPKGIPITLKVLPERPEPLYRTELPKNPDRAVAVFDGGKFIRLLDFMGPGFSYLDTRGMLIDYMSDEKPGEGLDGLLMFEGQLCSCFHDTYDGREYDEWLEGSWRKLTQEEREYVQNEEWPWDPDLWLEDGWRELVYGKPGLEE
jgi:hypothetical protein